MQTARDIFEYLRKVLMIHVLRSRPRQWSHSLFLWQHTYRADFLSTGLLCCFIYYLIWWGSLSYWSLLPFCLPSLLPKSRAYVPQSLPTSLHSMTSGEVKCKPSQDPSSFTYPYSMNCCTREITSSYMAIGRSETSSMLTVPLLTRTLYSWSSQSTTFSKSGGSAGRWKSFKPRLWSTPIRRKSFTKLLSTSLRNITSSRWRRSLWWKKPPSTTTSGGLTSSIGSMREASTSLQTSSATNRNSKYNTSSGFTSTQYMYTTLSQMGYTKVAGSTKLNPMSTSQSQIPRWC